jgi:hypothetical protein
VDRGSHTLQARLLDKTGQELMVSESILFHMRRESDVSKELQELESEASGDKDVDASQFQAPDALPAGQEQTEFAGEEELPSGEERTEFEGGEEPPPGVELPEFEGEEALPPNEEQPKFEGERQAPPPEAVHEDYEAVEKNKTSPALQPASPGYKFNW